MLQRLAGHSAKIMGVSRPAGPAVQRTQAHEMPPLPRSVMEKCMMAASVL
jgi:hypothetical protein